MDNKAVHWRSGEGAVFIHRSIRWTMVETDPRRNFLIVRDPKNWETLKIPLRQEIIDKPHLPVTNIDAYTEEEIVKLTIIRAILELIIGAAYGTVQNLLAFYSEKLGFSTKTLSRWKQDYLRLGSLDFLRVEKNGGRFKSRLDPATEKIVQTAIKRVLLSTDRRSKTAAINAVADGLESASKSVSQATVYRRIAQIPRQEMVRRREGKRAHEEQYTMYPELSKSESSALAPLDIVQIDHAKLDVFLVSQEARILIARPWLTLIIDIFTRMILGYELSFLPPSANKSGLCLINAIWPKDSLMAKYSLTYRWPCFGFPKIVQMDNARDFKCEMIKRGLQSYNITPDFRPVRRPNIKGAHIERLIGTMMLGVQDLPGGTKYLKHDGNITKPALSINELEAWLLNRMTGIYHTRIHSSLGMTPLEKWTEYYRKHPLPVQPANFTELRNRFKPFEERTVQSTGIEIFNSFYYGDCLRPWLEARRDGDKRKFIVKYDPEDIRTLDFFDPQLEKYFTLTRTGRGDQALTLKEWQEHRRAIIKPKTIAGRLPAHINTYRHMQGIVTDARRETSIKDRVRNEQKRRHKDRLHLENASPAQPIAPASRTRSAPPQPSSWDDVPVIRYEVEE